VGGLGGSEGDLVNRGFGFGNVDLWVIVQVAVGSGSLLAEVWWSCGGGALWLGAIGDGEVFDG
jgi:hypothetical protein